MNTPINLLTIRAANSSDIAPVTALNRHFVNAYNSNSLTHGFIKNLFVEEHIRTLVDANRVVVALNGEELAGYYLANDLIDTPAVVARKITIARLIEQEQLPAGRYAHITQAAIAVNYQGKGVGKNLLKALKLQVSPYLDYLVGYIDKLNHNAYESHTRSGWKVVSEEQDGFVAYTPTIANP